MAKLHRPIRENLLRQLALAEEYLTRLYELGVDGHPVKRAEQEVEKLKRLTSDKGPAKG